MFSWLVSGIRVLLLVQLLVSLELLFTNAWYERGIIQQIHRRYWLELNSWGDLVASATFNASSRFMQICWEKLNIATFGSIPEIIPAVLQILRISANSCALSCDVYDCVGKPNIYHVDHIERTAFEDTWFCLTWFNASDVLYTVGEPHQIWMYTILFRNQVVAWNNFVHLLQILYRYDVLQSLLPFQHIYRCCIVSGSIISKWKC